MYNTGYANPKCDNNEEKDCCKSKDMADIGIVRSVTIKLCESCHNKLHKDHNKRLLLAVNKVQLKYENLKCIFWLLVLFTGMLVHIHYIAGR